MRHLALRSVVFLTVALVCSVAGAYRFGGPIGGIEDMPGENTPLAVYDDVQLRFGSTVDAVCEYDTASTPDTLVCGVGADSNVWIVAETADINAATDWAKSLQTNPTLCIQSADSTSVTDRICFTHNQTNAVITSDAGAIVLDSASDSITFSSEDLSGINSIVFDTSPSHVHTEGAIHWDADDKTLHVDTEVAGTALQVGQEVWVRATNKTGAQIDDGVVVYINGAQGSRPTIAKADADTIATAVHTIGVATQDIADNGTGYVTTFGLVRDVDTSGTPVSEVWAAGDDLYLSSTAGTMTKTRPAVPAHAVRVAYVLFADATSGILFVKPEVNVGTFHAIDSTEADTMTISHNGTDGVITSQVGDVNIVSAGGEISLGDHAVTNVGDIDVDSITPDGASWTGDDLASMTSADADPADAGVLRLGNAETICWEASPTGTDVCATVNSDEQFTYGGNVIPDITGTPINNQIAVWTDADTLEGDAELTWTGTTLNVGDGTGSGMYINLNGLAADYRLMRFQTAGSTRWLYGADNAAESGSDAGSNFIINAYTDAGAYLSQPFKITRSTGKVLMTGSADIRGGVVLNEVAADVDFRVESTGSTHILFVDASADAVGIGTAAPSEALDINGNIEVNGSVILTSGINSINNTSRLLFAGGDSSSTGANIELYGGAHATQANNAFYDGDTHTFRSQDTLLEYVELASAEVVFNDASADRDFRVESNGNANMLFVDGGNDRVGIGTSSPEYAFDVAGQHRVYNYAGGGEALLFETHVDNANDYEMVFRKGRGGVASATTVSDGDDTGTMKFKGHDGTGFLDTAYILSEVDGAVSTNVMPGRIGIYTTTTLGSVKRLQVDSAGTLTTYYASVFNEDSGDYDFRVESNGNANMLFVDGGADAVGIGTNAPETTLYVSAGTGDGFLLEDSNATTSAPAIRSMGKRNDGNVSQSFAGKLVAEHLRTDSAITTGINLGSVIFGGNHTDGTEANIAYPASISGQSEGTFSDVNTMATALVFRTGSVGRATLDVPNVGYGTERMRIDSTGQVGIGTLTPSADLDVVGDVEINGDISVQAATTETRYVRIGEGRSGNGYAYFDLVGDATYTTYGLRFTRDNTGPNAISDLLHRGTGALRFSTQDSGAILLYVGGASAANERVRMTTVSVVVNEGGESIDFKAEGATDANLLFVDASADYVGIGTNTPSAKLDVVGDVEINGDMSIDGNITLTDTVYDDVRAPAITLKLGGAGNPDLVQLADNGAGSTGVFTYAFDKSTDEYLIGAFQLPHSYKDGTDLDLHVHWAPSDTDTGNVVWGVEYTVADIDGTFGNTTIVTVTDAGDGTAKKHQYVDVGDVSGTGLGGSAMIFFRVYRDADNAADTYDADAYLLETDMHFQADKLGSDGELPL